MSLVVRRADRRYDCPGTNGAGDHQCQYLYINPWDLHGAGDAQWTRHERERRAGEPTDRHREPGDATSLRHFPTIIERALFQRCPGSGNWSYTANGHVHRNGELCLAGDMEYQGVVSGHLAYGDKDEQHYGYGSIWEYRRRRHDCRAVSRDLSNDGEHLRHRCFRCPPPGAPPAAPRAPPASSAPPPATPAVPPHPP